MKKENEELEGLVARLRSGDEEAAAHLWDQYFQRLVQLASQRIPQNMRRIKDGEDVALSAFNSFVQGVRGDRFPDLTDEENLWGLLITLTVRKVHALLRHQTRQKRGGGKVRGESIFIDPRSEAAGGDGLQNRVTSESDPANEAELAEAFDSLLEKLPEPQLRHIAILRMEGYLVDEIAEMLGVSKRAVERRLQLIRKIWSEEQDSLDEAARREG